MSKLSFAPKMRRVAITGEGERLVHYDESVGRQQTATLCGWEGGLRWDHDVEDVVGCKDCLAIVAFFDSARKSRGAP